MADRTIAVAITFDSAGAVKGIEQLDDRVLKAARDMKRLERNTKQTRSVVVRSFNQMAAAARGFRKILGGLRRTLLTLRVLVLGFFIKQLFNVVQAFFGSITQFDQTIQRIAFATQAAQKRFNILAGTIKDNIDQITILRREFNQFSLQELAEVVAGTAELQRNFGLSGEEARFLNRRILDIAVGTGRTLVDVITRIRSGFLGSTEAIEDLGVNFKIFRLQQEALREGMVKQFQTLSLVEQATIRYKVLLKDTSELQDIVAKGANTIAGRMRQLNATWSDFVLLLSQAVINTRLFNFIFAGLKNAILFFTNELGELSAAGRFVLKILNGILGSFGALITLLANANKVAAKLATGDILGALTLIPKLLAQGFQNAQLDPKQFGIPITELLVDDFRSAIREPQPISEMVAAIQAFVSAAADKFETSQAAAGAFGLRLPPGFVTQAFEQNLESVTNFIAETRKRITEELAKLADSGDALAVGTLQAQANAVENFSKKLEAFKITLKGVTSTTDLKVFVAALKELGQTLDGAVIPDLEKTLLVFRNFQEGVRDITQEVNQLIRNLLSSLASLFADLTSGEAEESLKKFFASLLGVLGDFAIQLGTLLVIAGLALAIGLGGLNPGAMIAFGLALVAIGGVLKGISQRFGGGAGATQQAGIARPVSPEAIQLDLAGISPQQGIPQAIQNASVGNSGTIEVLNSINEKLSAITTKPGVAVVKDGIQQAGGVLNVTTAADRRGLRQSSFGRSTLNAG